MINGWALVAPTVVVTSGLAWRMKTARRRRHDRAAARVNAGRVALRREAARLAADNWEADADMRRSAGRLHAAIPTASTSWRPLPRNLYDWDSERGGPDARP